MKIIDFSRKMTYIRALLLPFSISPIATTVQLIFQLIDLIAAPIRILILAYFIDTTIEVVTDVGDWNRILPPLFVLGAVHLYANIVAPFLSLIALKQQQKAWLVVDHPLVKTYAALDIKHTENRETADLTHRVLDENSPANMLMSVWGNFSSFIFSLGQIVSYAIILIINAPLVGVFIIVVTLPVILLAQKAAKEKFKINQDISKYNRLRSYHLHFQRSRGAVAERKLFGFMPMLHQKYLETFHTVRRLTFDVEMKWNFRDNFVSFLLTCIGAAALLMMLPSVQNGNISVGIFISLIGVLFSTLSYVTWNLSHYFQAFTRQREYLKEFSQYMQLSRMQGALDIMSENPPPFKTLNLKNISFKYPGTDKQVLSDVTMTIEAGKRYSLVGANGCGKTTLAKLLLRLYDDYEGEILLNDKPLKNWEMADIKAIFTAVFQNFEHFDISVADNIAVGSGLRSAETEIDQAIDIVGLKKTVSSLKDGKNTLVGKIYEDSVELSGGQWQKIAMARAVISPAQVKILDEPTAALDPMAEQEVYTRFSEISKNAATIFISHRLASAKMADIVFVMDNGRIVEQGSHDQLMNKNGLYAKMFESQREWYV